MEKMIKSGSLIIMRCLHRKIITPLVMANVQFFMLDSNEDMGQGSANNINGWKMSYPNRRRYGNLPRIITHRTQEMKMIMEILTKESSTFGDENVQKILPLYEKYHIDIVWYGHMHYYERTWPIRDGLVDVEKGNNTHIQTGGSRR